MVTLRKSDGSKPGNATYSAHRSGLAHLFREYNVTMTPELSESQSRNYLGLRRTTAQRTADGEGRIKVGKDPMDFPLLKFICESLLKSKEKENVFGRCFILICWNLMCRAGNVVSICLEHLEWRNDSLCIYFAHMKNDQTGNRKRDPRHIYANPVSPEICPVLALGVYLLVFSIVPNQNKLFPGNSQYQRFSKLLMKFSKNEGRNAIEERGLQAVDIGTHSVRKGAATYVSSGSTACPSSTAIQLRAGWSLPGVQDTYLRYESAGDMHVRRVVSGLPQESANFSILPPFFEVRNETVDNAINNLFPNAPINMKRVCEFCVASVVYHSDYLRNNLPETHLLFSNYLFTDLGLLSSLKAIVKCRRANENDVLTATGIPPFVNIINNLVTLNESILKILPALEKSSNDTAQMIINELEDRAIGAGTVTRDGLTDLLKQSVLEILNQNGVIDAIQQINSGNNSAPIEQTAAERQENNMWSFMGRELPATFKIPSVNILIGFQLWCIGDPQHHIPPYRLILPQHIPNLNTRKRFCDFQVIMKFLEAQARAASMWVDDATIQDVNAVMTLMLNSENLSFLLRTKTNRRRRINQISWRTAAEDVRERKRQ
eukprot:NODE_139_length_16235_cov_0.569038.p3 type:complete len:603 gc:universal NODE_139_length_16235_cov_0.569038:14135-15943(+)